MQEKDYQKNLFFTAIVAGSIFFSLLYSLLSWVSSPKSGNRIFNSPDETSNFSFTKLVTEKNAWSIPEPLNAEYHNSIYPRGTSLSATGDILPGSFLGLIILYGIAAKFLGSWSIVYLTPFVACFGSIYFYKLIRHIFSEKIAFLSVLLLWVFPGWWYYSSRSMFHNVLFISLAIIAFYHLVIFTKTGTRWRLLGAILFLALGLLTRLAEAVWVSGVFFSILLLHRSAQASWQKKLFGLIICFLAGLGILAIQAKVFQNALAGAYPLEIFFGPWTHRIGRFVFPFGIDIRHSLKTAYWFLIHFFWWYAVGGLAGMAYCIIRYRNLPRAQRIYLWSFLGISVFLILSYGAWNIADHIGPDWVSLDSSYVRYWLPIYVMGLPFLANWMQAVIFSIRGKTMYKLLLLGVAIIYGSAGFYLVYGRPHDGIAAVAASIEGYYQKRSRVEKLVPDNAIIATERSDKIFFPTYSVVSAVANPAVLGQLKKMVEAGEPVFWYSHYSGQDEQVFGPELAVAGLRLNNAEFIGDQEYLYILHTKDNP